MKLTPKHQKIADDINKAFEKMYSCDAHEWRFDEKRCLYYCKKCRACKTPLQYALWLKEGDEK